MERGARLGVVAVLVAVLAVSACSGCSGGSSSDGGGGGSKKGTSTATAGPVDEFAGIDTAEAGTISGKVSFTGPTPTPEKIKLGADPVCKDHYEGSSLFQEHEMLNEDGTLKNVFVWIKGGMEGKTFPVPNEPVVLDQKGCRYEPHVFGLRAGQPLKILNSDPTSHNIHALPKKNKGFNKSMPRKGMKLDQEFKKTEVPVYIKCDVHPWMNAYAGVLEHPYWYVTGKAGTYELKNVPPGEYTIGAFHEKWGFQEQKVTVEAKGTVTADLSYDGTTGDQLIHKTVYKK